jgi:hypothetical protein
MLWKALPSALAPRHAGQSLEDGGDAIANTEKMSKPKTATTVSKRLCIKSPLGLTFHAFLLIKKLPSNHGTRHAEFLCGSTAEFHREI